MLVLYETSAGYALFKVTKPNTVLDHADKLWEAFQTPEQAASLVKLKAFSEFHNTTDAVVAATHMIEGTLDKSLKKFLKKNIQDKELSDELAVADVKLGGLINKSLDIKCIFNDAIHELYRGIRTQLDSLLGDTGDELKAMQLGLSHSLSRYKLKFTADKVDIMIVQAIGLLDDLDKEVNIYAMRVREWYGWHFPEMAKIINDNIFYAKCIKRMGYRSQCKNHDFSDILGDEILEETLKRTAETSMGTEISESDLSNISALCDQVISLSEYRLQLYEYLQNRMAAIAPNLTTMVGELVGARLIAHSGSLLNLAKHPASTIQILGAEKALFRALKTKHDTPKYGLIYHASLIGQATPKNKGKISRVLAAKTALAIRVDAMGETEGPTIAIENKIKVENRLRQLEGGQKMITISTPKGSNSGPSKYDPVSARALAPPKFNDASDMILVDKKKRPREEDNLVTSNGSASKKSTSSNGIQMFATSSSSKEDPEEYEENGEENEDEHESSQKKKKKKEKKEKRSSLEEGNGVRHEGGYIDQDDNGNGDRDVERSQKKKKEKKSKD